MPSLLTVSSGPLDLAVHVFLSHLPVLRLILVSQLNFEMMGLGLHQLLVHSILDLLQKGWIV